MRERLARTLERFRQDLRYAVRGLRKSRGFAITVVATLGLGIGANAAMFGIVDRLMFRPLPYLRDPATVNLVYLQTTVRGRVVTNTVFPYTRYLDIQRSTTSFAQTAAFSLNTLAVGTGDDAREQPTLAVSASFFDFFDAHPALGRFIGPADDVVPRGATVAVLDFGFWQREFGGRNVLGQSVQIGSLVYTIIGVAPKGFVGVASGSAPAVYIPITTIPANDNPSAVTNFYTGYRWDFTSMMVRRKPGVAVSVANADLSQAYARSRDAARIQMPTVVVASIAHPTGIAGSIKPAAGPGAGLESKTLLWVSGVAVIVLLIACANVANLMIARILSGRREIAVRLALGVSRGRLVSQLLTESLLLAGAGAVAGVLLAQWGSAALHLLVPADNGDAGVVTDWRTLGLAAVCAILTAMLIAIGPALLAVRGDLAETLRAGARGGTYQRSRVRSALLVMQGALSVILLVGAGLFVRSLDRVRAMPLGYDAEQVLLALPKLRGARLDSVERVRFFRDLLQTARSIPGVEAAAAIDSRPFATSMNLLYVDGVDSVQALGRFDFQVASADYFRVMNTRILRGRPFTAADGPHSPRVSVVSNAMAKALWPGKDPLGQCIHVGTRTADCTTVIGVAEDAAYEAFTDDRRFVQYVPIEQYGSDYGNKLVLRVRGMPEASIETVRHALQQAMPGQGYVTVQPFEDLVDTQRRSWVLGAAMFVAFGGLALLVAAVGLYGVIAYNVAQRTHELGVRIALGAQWGDVVRLVVGQGMSFAIAGVACGLGIALLAARWIQPMLFHQSATDPVTYGVVGGIVVLVAIVASATPAARATRADPNIALRAE